jgi:hypothetical protein
MPTNLTSVASGAVAGAKIGSIVPGVGTAIGALLGGAAGLFAGKQKAPPQAVYQPVDVQEEQRRAIAGNLANFDAAATLAAKGNTFSQNEAARLLEQAIPGFGALQKRLLASVDADLSSQTTLPADVQDQIARFAAEKGVTRGTSGNFNAFSLVKDFGFNLVDWQQAARARALNTLSTVYGFAPRVNVMSPMASMVDPSTAIQVASQNNQAQFGAAQAGYNAQTAAANYQRSQLGGLLQSAGTLAGLAYDGVQAKAKDEPPPAAPTYLAKPTPADRYQLPFSFPTYASTLPTR